MRVDQVLLLLLSALSIKNHKVVLSWLAVNLWQKEAFKLMLDCRLITPISNAAAIQCQGCEHHCNVDVIPHVYPNKTKYYAICDHPIMHEQMGRLTIPNEQLKQWQISIGQLAKVIRHLLALTTDIRYSKDNKVLSLGMLKSDTGRKWINLIIEPLSLEVNQHILPIADILYFDGDKLTLDNDRLKYSLNNPANVDDSYKPKVSKRELQRANKLAKYKSWHDEYIILHRQHPKQNDSWISRKIALMPIADGASSETIRKNMKK
ncbi:hypothetical protein RGQ13_12305 [Thalassotalea psychrophila]|uniref:Uncharacterized protein n=1 Tax=Thalassotalea psychrophila TaxID=3065647 RepID=A0ABY9TQS5_9GAMM|nr:hypothetical protein RGQ13_12305 [Colwelliaceae bacterium SQ149]